MVLHTKNYSAEEYSQAESVKGESHIEASFFMTVQKRSSRESYKNISWNLGILLIWFQTIAGCVNNFQQPPLP
jgi:hypothetical protein